MSVELLRRQLAALAALPEVAVKDAAAHVIEIAEHEGGTVRLGRKRRRYPLGGNAHFYTPSGGAMRATVWGVPTGPWVWKNTGRDGGYPIPKRRRKKARYIHGAGYAHPINAHATIAGGAIAARYRWRAVIARARAETPAVFHRAIAKAVAGGR